MLGPDAGAPAAGTWERGRRHPQMGVRGWEPMERELGATTLRELLVITLPLRTELLALPGEAPGGIPEGMVRDAWFPGFVESPCGETEAPLVWETFML